MAVAVMTHDNDSAAAAARIESIFIARKAAAPIESRESAVLIPGRGIEGDRYALGTGCYSGRFLREPGRHLTMVSADGVLEATRRAGADPLDIGDLRRNIVLRGLSAGAVNDMVGHEVLLGERCRVFVHRRTVPCKYREAACRRRGLMNDMWEACGVSCEILPPLAVEGGGAGGKGPSGEIRVGDIVTVIPGTHDPRRIDVGIKPPAFFIRPAERTLKDVKKLMIPPHLAALAAMWDPEGFQRLEETYNRFGQHFWSPRAYSVGLTVKRMRFLLLAVLLAVFISIVNSIIPSLNGAEL